MQGGVIGDKREWGFVILVSRFGVCASLQECLDNLCVPIPCRVVQRGGAPRVRTGVGTAI